MKTIESDQRHFIRSREGWESWQRELARGHSSRVGRCTSVGGDETDRVLSALQKAISRCRGPEESWMAQDLKRAMILIGGLDEEVAQRILDQDGL
jgi:hypothetical protein